MTRTDPIPAASVPPGADAPAPERDHGGDLDRAIARFGGARRDWLDLSTGVNPDPYPIVGADGRLVGEGMADEPPFAWARLPSASAEADALRAARRRYGAPDGVAITAAPGAQAVIQALPRVIAPLGRVAVVSPTYNEHAAAFDAEGWRVRAVAGPEEAADDEALVIVNPNNPDGRRYEPRRLAALADRRPVIVDESFVDTEPGLSVTPWLGAPGLIALRSFGKFYGLAGLRLGFALGAPAPMAALRRRLGPWAVSGPALAIGAHALSDDAWAAQAVARAAERAAALDALVAAADGPARDWRAIGGTALFRLIDTADARAAQTRLAEARIWTRAFPYSDRWLRMGLPRAADLPRLAAALGAPLERGVGAARPSAE